MLKSRFKGLDVIGGNETDQSSIGPKIKKTYSFTKQTRGKILYLKNKYNKNFELRQVFVYLTIS